LAAASADSAEKHAKTQYKILHNARRAEWKAKAQAELNAAAKVPPGPRRRFCGARKKPKLTPAEQCKRFIDPGKELDIPDTEAAQECAFGEAGLNKSK
jgi:hypothetical protein